MGGLMEGAGRVRGGAFAPLRSWILPTRMLADGGWRNRTCRAPQGRYGFLVPAFWDLETVWLYPRVL